MEAAINTELILAFFLLVSAVLSFALEKVKIETTSICLLIIILLIGMTGLENWPSLKEVCTIFSSEAPLAIIAMFMVSGALSKQGIIERVTSVLQNMTRFGYHSFLFILLLSVACFSGFINNTPVVVILLPVAIGLSKTLGVPSSKLLIPISYASIFGGCCTLIGTSTNILASGFMSSSNYYPEMGPMKMFELTKIGLPLMFIGLAFLVIFGRRLLPEREALSKILADIDRKEFLTEVLIVSGSTLVGQSLRNCPLSKIPGVRLLDVVRDGKNFSLHSSDTLLHVGDKLILSCKPQGLIDVREAGGEFFDQNELGVQQLNSSEAIMVEAMVKPTSGLLTCTLEEADLRGRFNLMVVAIHRRGKNIRLRLDEIKLELGDTLLLLGTQSGVEKLRESREAVLLDKPPLLVDKKSSHAYLTIGSLIAIIACSSFGVLPLYAIALLGAGFLVLTKSINLKDAIKSVEWNLLLLIYSMLALGMVMEKSGASANLADVIKFSCTQGIGDEWQIIAALVILYLFTAILTELLSNNATIAIMTPVALMLAFQFNLNSEEAKAFVLTCCIAASASFMTPIGYQTNTFVYTVGGYRFKDFARFGVWPMMIYFFGTIFLVGLYWNFFP